MARKRKDFLAQYAFAVDEPVAEFADRVKQLIRAELDGFRAKHPDLVGEQQLLTDLLRHLKSSTVLFLAAQANRK
jgi:hypothetical protein